MNIKKLLAFSASFGLAAMASVASAATGESWKSTGSISVGSSKTVTLVAERNLDYDSKEDDPEDKYYDNGCYYFKFTAKRGSSFTITTAGASESNEIDLSVDDVSTYDWNKDVWCPTFSIDTESDGYNYRATLAADDWDEDCDSSVTYYIYVSGEIGKSVTVSMAAGVIEPAKKVGSEENPKPIAFSTALQTHKDTLYGTYYCLTATLVEGNKYKIGTTDGTADNRLSITVEADAEGEDAVDPDTSEFADWTDDNNEGWIVVANWTGKHWFTVEGDEDGASFGVRYQMVGARKPEAHTGVLTLAAPTADGTEVELDAPGRRNALNSGFYDSIIDEQLVKVNLKAGKYYRFAVEGADTNLCLEVYAKGGSAADAKTSGCKDPVLTYVPAKDGDYYVGVCQDLADDEADEPTCCACTLTATLLAKGDGLTDDFDPDDDTYAGASGLTFNAGTLADDIVEEGATHGPHTLGATDWTDTFAIAARKGLTYRLQSALGEHAAGEGWKLAGTVFTVNAKGVRSNVTSFADLNDGISFTADAHGTYYVEVSVAGGRGRDYGPYNVHSLVCDPAGGSLGTLTVDVGGATASEGARWSLVSDGTGAPQYTSGASVLLPAGSYAVAFATVSGWTAPARATAVVPNGGAVTVSAKYSDTCDDATNDAKNGDGSTSGKKVTTLKPSVSEQKVSRSLWKDDAADWFKFTTVANGSYSFALAPSTKLGDAKIFVYRANAKDVVAEGTDVSFLCKEAKVTYWVCVKHGSSPAVDSQYVMSYRGAQVGSLGFKATAVSVKDSAASVKLTVSRKNGKEGAVGCRYTTRAGTAVAGRHYVAQTGTLSWANGDMKDKTIVVTLIPDLVAKWEEDRAFDVEIAAVDAFDPDEGEYVPNFGATKATVTISDATKKTTGSVSFGAWGDDDAAFANAKKPTADVRAGETLRLRLDRTGGSDGQVAVTVTPTKGTAAADVNFDDTPKTVVWADGDAEPKYVSLVTYDVGDAYQASKNLTMKLAADATYADKAKVGAAVTVVIGDPNATQSVDDYAATAKEDGIVVKQGKDETWYFDAAGDLRNVVPAKGGKADLTLTVTGPGKFTFNPQFDNGGNAKNAATVKIGKETVAITGEEIVKYLAKGKQTVSISVSRDASDKTSGPVLSFADLGESKPFAWQTLPAATLVSPLAGEVLVAYEDEYAYEHVQLLWADAGEGVKYLFYLDADKKNLGTAKAEYAFENEGALAEPAREMDVGCKTCGLLEGQLDPDKTYYWRVDTAFVDDEGKVLLRNDSTAVWTLQMRESDAAKAVLAGGTDAYGNPLAEIEPVGTTYPITLVQGVAANLVLDDEDAEGTVSYALANGSKLPTGLTLKGNRITGTPSKAGTYGAIVQISTKSGKTTTAGGTLSLAITVEKLELAAGTFNGLVFLEDAEGVDAGELGSLTATVTDAGKISATVSIAGTAYRFSASGWTGVVPATENGQPGVTAELTCTTKSGSKSYKNILTLTAGRGTSADAEALDTPLAAELELGATGDDYAGRAYRDNRKVSSALEGMKAFTGYYTVSLVPTNAPAGVSGYGYVTLTVDAKGGVKAAGVLADGATKIASSATGYVAEGPDGEPALYVPLYAGSSKTAFGGWLVLQADEDGVIVARADRGLVWINENKSATAEGTSGFRIGIEPTGGFYSKLYNLQAYYSGWNLGSGAIEFDDLEDLLFGSKEPVCYPGLYGDYLNVAGNAITAKKQVKAYRADNKKLIDWTKTVNPANVAFTFKQATGLYSGSFEMWGGNAEAGSETTQTKIGTYKHQGVLVMNRDAAAALRFEDAAMPGFWLAPIKISKRTWTATLPFVIAPSEAAAVDEGF